MTYKQRKAAARDTAIQWQTEFINHCYSYDELCAIQSIFEALARRYGLLKEFRENAII